MDLIDFCKSAPVDLDQVATKLKLDVNRSYKAILVVQTDTASSVSNDIAALGECICSSGHPALYMSTPWLAWPMNPLKWIAGGWT